MPIAALFLILSGAVAVAWLYPAYRVLAGAVVLLFLGLIAAYFLTTGSETDRATSRIPADALVLEDVKLGPIGTAQRLTGRVTNRSDRYTLLALDLRVTLDDCPEPDSAPEECETIAESDGTALVDVPPGQSRAFQAALRFADVPEPHGTIVWREAVTGTRASE